MNEYKEVLRSTNNVINELDKIYQKYYIDVFWYKENLEKAETNLFTSLWIFCGENENLEKNSQIEVEVELPSGVEEYSIIMMDGFILEVGLIFCHLAKCIDDILLFYYGYAQVEKDVYVMTSQISRGLT